MKKIYIQPKLQVVKLCTLAILAGSQQQDEIRSTTTENGDNTLSGGVYNGNDYNGPQRAKAHESWDSWD